MATWKTIMARPAEYSPAASLEQGTERAGRPSWPSRVEPTTRGTVSGDVKVNPHGRVRVMTTEILRNALYGSGLEDLGYIVLDECHYMGDEGRGTVWEEIIVNAPQDVLLVGLSATVANVKEIADWISIVHRPIVPIFHPHRPVPLSYAVADLAGDLHDIADVRRGRAPVVGD